MKTKPAILAFFALAAIAMQGLFTSCAGDESLSTEKQEGLQTLKINLKPADTRAAAYADPGTTAENKINSVTIGIFDQNTGNAVKTIQDAPDPANPTITTSQLAKDDIVLVAVNAPAGTFKGVLTESDFEKSILAIDDALPVNGTGGVDYTKLPMFGTGSIVQGGSSTAFTANVSVSHMVAKVTLKSLKVAFDATGAYKDATFTPTEVFMYNVPEKLEFNPVDTYTYIYADGKYYSGWTGDNTFLKAYLGTGTLDGTLSGKVLKGDASATTTNSWGTNLVYLYTMPNNSATPTQLVIKGTFDPDGKNGTNVGTVYYPVNINYNSVDGTAADLSIGKDGTVKHVYPNKNYIVDVTIKGKGADLPSISLDPQTATATITVNSFVNANQSNVFN